MLSSLTCSLDALYRLASDSLNVNLIELLNKEFAVFGCNDGLHRSTQYLHVVAIQNTLPIESHSAVERSLSSKGKQDAIRAFFGDYFLYKKRCHREEINLIRNTLTCLHSGNIWIDKDGLNAFFSNSFESLGTGIIKFPCFSYLKSTRAEY